MAHIGGLRAEITFERKVQVGLSDLNAAIFEWVAWREDIWAEIVDRRGNERFENEQRYDETMRIFRVRRMEVEGLTTEYRIRYDGQLHNIKNIMPDHARREMVTIEAAIQDQQLGPVDLEIFGEPATEATEGSVYRSFFGATGGTGPYTFSVAEGDLPAGVTLSVFDDHTAMLAGTPTESGTFSGIVIQVTDAVGATADLSFDLAVDSEPSP